MTDRTPKPCTHKSVTHRHGHHRAFIADGCRCWECVFAHNEWDRARRIRTRDFGPGWVELEPVVRHVRSLRETGATLREIADAADVSLPSLSGVLHHKGKTAILASLAEKILSTTSPLKQPPERLPEAAVVSAVGSRRRIQALTVIGWSQGEIAELAGMSIRTVWELSTRDREGVLVRYHLAVSRVYDALWDKEPPAVTVGQRTAIKKRRKAAGARGWAPPMAWDDADLDDPDATPQIAPPGADDIRMEMYRQGMTDRQIAKETGANREAIAKWRQKHRLPTNYDRKPELGDERDNRMEMWEQGMNDDEIAAAVGKHRDVIRRWRVKHGLESRRRAA